MNVNGPVSMTVTIEMNVDLTSRMLYTTEFVVADSDEAREKGEQFHELVMAFNNGFGEA